MLLLTLIFGIVLLPQVHTLRCHECVPDTLRTCIDTEKECFESQQCGTFSTTTYAGGSKVADVNSKSCASTAECFEASFNFGSSKIVINNTCCNSNLCNNQPATGPSSFIPNGKKCFQCKGKDCTATLDCEGSEDRCISTKVTLGGETTTVKGCASKLACLPEAKKMTQVSAAEINCCQGDYCNSARSTSSASSGSSANSVSSTNSTSSASSTSAGLLLLAAPLVSLVVLS